MKYDRAMMNFDGPRKLRCLPFPVISLTKVLFHFIARGHKTIAYLPFVFKKWFWKAAKSKIDDLIAFRKLLDLNLLHFLDEADFFLSLKHEAIGSKGILITSGLSLIMENNEMVKKDDKDISIEDNEFCNILDRFIDYSDINDIHQERTPQNEEFNAGSSGTLPETSLKFNKNGSIWFCIGAWKCGTKPGNGLLVIEPIFRGPKRRLTISLDALFHFPGKLAISSKDYAAKNDYNFLLKMEQITLLEQYHLLKELEKILNGDYPRGIRDIGVVNIVKSSCEKL